MSRRPKKKDGGSPDLQVDRLASLSRLSLAPGEAKRLGDELKSILEYFATLDKVDVSGVSFPKEEVQEEGTREDTVRESAPDEILTGVPQKKGRLVKAPRVF